MKVNSINNSLIGETINVIGVQTTIENDFELARSSKYDRVRVRGLLVLVPNNNHA